MFHYYSSLPYSVILYTFIRNWINCLNSYYKSRPGIKKEKDKLYYILILFLYKTGLRISEALALRWDDIDCNMININKQTSRDDNNKVILTTLKNETSYRKISIDEEVIRVLKKFKAKQNELILGNQDLRKIKMESFFKITMGIILHLQFYVKRFGTITKLQGLNIRAYMPLEIHTLSLLLNWV